MQWHAILTTSSNIIKFICQKKGCPAGLGTSEPIEVCTKKKVLICVDSSSSDEAGASIGKNLHKGKSPQATYLEAFDKQKVCTEKVS